MSLLLCLAVSCDDSGIDSSIITPDKVEEKVYFAGSIPTYIKDALKHYMPAPPQTSPKRKSWWAVLQGSDSPSEGYGDNDLGTLS